MLIFYSINALIEQNKIRKAYLIMKKNYIITFLLLISIISLFFNIKFILTNKNSFNTITTQSNNYYDFIDYLINDFEFEGYTEILNHYNHMLSLPIQAKEDDLLNRQKMFVYKNKSKSTILLLSLSMNSQTNSIEWNSCFDYLPNYFNGTTGQFSDSYDKNYPNVQVACNSFIHSGISVTAIALSNHSDKNIAGEEVIGFSNKFIQFIKERK